MSITHRHYYNSRLTADEEEALVSTTSSSSATTTTMPPSNKHMDNQHPGDLELQLMSTSQTGTHHRHPHEHGKGGDDEHHLVTVEMNSSNSSSNNNNSSINNASSMNGNGSSSHHCSSKPKSLLLLLGSAANVKAFTSCLLYSFCSVSMVLTNKSLTSSYSKLYVGDLNILLVVFQAIVAVISVHICKSAGLVDYPPVTVGTLRGWAGVNVLFCLMLFTGMLSLQYNSVPMVTVFKNVANIFTATGDYFIFGNESGKLAMAAFAVMLFGAIAAASKDIECTATGLFWMMANCLSTSGYVLYMKHATQTVKTTKFGMVFLNNVLCVVFLLPVAYAFGEVSIFMESKALHSMDYFTKNMFAGFVGFFLNFASLNCVQATGPTTYAIVGSVNKIPVAFLGYLLFDNMITADTWFFISVSMCGGFLYSFATLRSPSK